MDWKRTSREPHPAGVWRAQFVEWKEEKHETFGVQVKLTFDTEVLMADGKPFRISTWTKPSLHKKGKVFKLLAAFGVDAEKIPDEDLKTFTLDDYCGRKLKVVIEHQIDEGDVKDRIVSFQPFKATGVQVNTAFAEEDAAAPAPPAASNGKSNGKKAEPAAPPATAPEPAPEPVAAAAATKTIDWEED